MRRNPTVQLRNLNAKCHASGQIEFHRLPALLQKKFNFPLRPAKNYSHIGNSSPRSDEITVESAEIFPISASAREQHEKLI
jgi:hypothetical protein